MSRFKRIPVYEAEQILDEHDNVMILDCRDSRSYCRSHHSHAIHLSDVNIRTLLKKTPKTVHLIIYCYHGNLSQDFAGLFADFGFAHVYSLDGGYEAWQQAFTYPASSLDKPTRNWLAAHNFSESELDAANEEGLTPLMRAAFEGREDLVRVLIDRGAEPDLCDRNGNNALWYACLAGNVDCVKKLIYADIDVDRVNLQGMSPINYAVACGRDDLIEELIAGGADHGLEAQQHPGRDTQLAQAMR